jgi:hypothetical protein
MMAVTPPGRRHTATWIVIAVLLAASIVGTLWVPFYNRTTPTLGSFPFFYWYQLLWVPAVALLSWLAYLLTKTTRSGPAGTAAAPITADPDNPAAGGEAG